MLAKVRLQLRDEPFYRWIPHVLVPLVLAQLLRHVRQRVERGVQRVDLLELQQLAAGELARLVQLSALQQVPEDVERRWPRADAYGRTGLGQRLRDREPEPGIVGHAGNQRALPLQVY